MALILNLKHLADFWEKSCFVKEGSRCFLVWSFHFPLKITKNVTCGCYAISTLFFHLRKMHFTLLIFWPPPQKTASEMCTFKNLCRTKNDLISIIFCHHKTHKDVLNFQ